MAMRRCRFEGNTDTPCPVPNEWPYGIVNQPCREDEYGRDCGAIVAQMIVRSTVHTETLHSVIDDIFGLINGQVRMTRTPAGLAPEAIREMVGKTTFPLRERREQKDGKIAVAHMDLYLRLLDWGHVEAANWYEAHRIEEGYLWDQLWWHFDTNEGDVSEREGTIDTIDFYDGSFHRGNPALYNSFFPPLLGIKRPQDLFPRTLQIKEFLSEMPK